MSEKIIMGIAIVLAVGGALALIRATVIATITIPDIDRNISDVDGEIATFKDARIISGICKLAYGEDFTKRRIEFFERNQLIIQKAGKAEIKELEIRALKDTAKLAEQWATLLAGDKMEGLKKTTKDKIDGIAKDRGMSFDDKIKALETLWQENMTLASERLRKMHDEWHKNETDKTLLEANRAKRNSNFVKWQIGGLIALALAGMMEGAVKIF